MRSNSSGNDRSRVCSVHTSAMFSYHLAVFLWGFAAILGKLISYGSFALVWHRMTIAFVLFAMIPSTWYELKKLSWRNIGIFFLIGIVVCGHWVAFYTCIKLGDSASIALACLGSITFFTAMLDPMIGTVPFSKNDLFTGMVVLVGLFEVYLSLPIHDESEGNAKKVYYGWAVVVGILSAFCASLFSVLNKLYIDRGTTLTISFIEMGSGALILSIIVPLMDRANTKWYPSIDPDNMTMDTINTGEWDLVWVLLLTVFCTNAAFYLSTSAMTHISAFTANLALSLEPIYGIIMGTVLLHENQDLNLHFYIGTITIVVAIFAKSMSSTCAKCSSSGGSGSSSSSSNGGGGGGGDNRPGVVDTGGAMKRTLSASALDEHFSGMGKKV